MVNIGFFYVFIVSMAFATQGIFAKFIYSYDGINANVLTFVSLFVSSLILFCVSLIKYKNFSFLKINKKEMLFSCVFGGLFCLFLNNIAVLKSLQYISVGIQKILSYSSPVFIIFINRFMFGKKINKNNMFCTIFILLGLYFIVGKIDFSGNNVLLGVILALSSAILSAIYSISAEEDDTNMDDIKYWMYAFLSSFVYMIIYMLLSNKAGEILVLENVDFKLFSLFLASSIVNFAIPYIALGKSIQILGAEKANIILTLTPVLTIVLGALVFKESLGLLQVGGVALIIISSLMVK